MNVGYGCIVNHLIFQESERLIVFGLASPLFFSVQTVYGSFFFLFIYVALFLFISEEFFKNNNASLSFHVFFSNLIKVTLKVNFIESKQSPRDY
jgi:predicted ABC-type exoprotein transport system permease subunit